MCRYDMAMHSLAPAADVDACGLWPAIYEETAGFAEAPINFPPTYRMIKGAAEYSNKKNQNPSYCDRVLHRAAPGHGVAGDEVDEGAQVAPDRELAGEARHGLQPVGGDGVVGQIVPDDADERPPHAASADVEDLALVACHDTRTGESCARECDRACEEAKERRRRAKAEAVAATCGATPAPTGAPAAAPSCRGGAKRAPPRSLCYSSDALGLSYRRPTSLAELQAVLQATPAARIVAANTAMGAAA